MLKVAQIIPLIKLPRGMDYFDYYIPKEDDASDSWQKKIMPGAIVNIPFRKKQMLKGIVHSIKNKTDFEQAKQIDSLDSDLGGLLPYQMELINWFAGYYHYSLAATARMLFPDVPKRNALARETQISDNRIELVKNPKILPLIEQFFCSNGQKALLFPHDAKLKELFYLGLCSNAVKDRKQILILFPQVQKVNEFFQLLPKNLQVKTASLTTDAHYGKNKTFQLWGQIRKNEKFIIIGTRSAVFSPLSNLQTIVIDAAHSEDFKQWDMTPRYEAVNVAQKIQQLTNCNLILSSLTPRIEDACNAKKNQYQMITLGAGIKNQVQLVDLREERKKGFTYLSEKLLREIDITLKQKKDNKVLLIVNKKGEYSYLFCDDCGFEANCPSCKLPFTIEGQNLVCYRCGQKQDLLLTCPNCRGVNLKKMGIGIEQISNEVKKRFTDAGRILLSTGQTLKKENFENIGLLGFVYLDSLVYLADFNSNFRLYCFQKELIGRAGGAGVIVQTSFADNLAFESLNLGYEYFYKKEIADRKQFSYPPFCTLIKLFFQHQDLGVCQKEAQELYDKLIKGSDKNIKITEPYLHYLQKVRKRYRCQIAVFLPLSNIELEKRFISDVPEYWTIDKNPVNLL